MWTVTRQLLEGYIAEMGGKLALPAIQPLVGREERRGIEQHPEAWLSALATAQGTSLDEILYWFGAYLTTTPLFAQALPGWRSRFATMRDFLLESGALLDNVVLRELEPAPGAELWTVDCALDLVEVCRRGRVGRLRLCRLLGGMIAGIGALFETPLQLREVACQYLGTTTCQILVRFPARASIESRNLSAIRAEMDPFTPAGRGPHLFQPPTKGALEAMEAATPEQEEDLVVLRILAVKAGPRGLTLFEIKHELERFPFTVGYARAGPLTLCLARLAEQGYVVGEVAARADARPQESSAETPQRYRITPAGRAHLRYWERNPAR